MSVAPQWISRIAMSVCGADNRSIIPLSDFIQQAHRTGVGDQCANFRFVNRMAVAIGLRAAASRAHAPTPALHHAL